jgi:hypothetical protein
LICEGPTSADGSQHFRRSTDWRRCEACDFAFVHPMPEQAVLDAYYRNGIYREEVVETRPKNFERLQDIHEPTEQDRDGIRRRVERWIPYIRDADRHLDVGSSWGGALQMIAAARTIGQSIGVEPGPWRESYTSYADLSEVKGTFDLVTCFHTLEHVADPVAFLRQIRKLAIGQVCVAVPYAPARAWPHVSEWSITAVQKAMSLAKLPGKLVKSGPELMLVHNTRNPNRRVETSNGRAFVIGNGPSLQRTDLDLLVGETTYAMNRIHLHYGKPGCEKWRPSHYLFVDYQTMMAWSMLMEELAAHIRAGEQVYVDSSIREQVYNKLKSPETMPDNVHFLDICEYSEHKGGSYLEPGAPTAWHLEEQRPYCKFASGLFTAMQVAVMEGHNPIILVGADLGYVEHKPRDPDPNHMSENYVQLKAKHLDLEYMKAEYAEFTNAKLQYGHEMALRSCKALGVDVLNATEGGALEVVPRIDLREAVYELA